MLSSQVKRSALLITLKFCEVHFASIKENGISKLEYSAFAVEIFFALKKIGSPDQFFEILASWLRNFSRVLYTQIKILTLQDHPLHMRDGGPLITKASNSTRILFSFLLLCR